MKTHTVIERIGERMGDVTLPNPDLDNYEHRGTVRSYLEMLESFKESKKIIATTDTGSPKFGYHELLDVCLYDGWPYWRPYPSFQVMGVLGVEWHSFCSLQDWRVTQ